MPDLTDEQFAALEPTPDVPETEDIENTLRESADLNDVLDAE